MPTPKSRPHDPALAPDGSLWYTGQMANKLGRLDPKTGQFKEYPLKTPDSGPHGLVADREGNLRAVDWTDHETRMRRFLRLHYGENGFRLETARKPNDLTYAISKYFDGE